MLVQGDIERVWKDEEWVFILGGGKSLESFPMELLEFVKVVGCNDAFNLGFPIVDVCLWCDSAWWERNKHTLDKMKREGSEMRIASADISHFAEKIKLAWLEAFPVTKDGFQQSGPQLAVNRSCGAAAAHLANKLGARKIILGGMDAGAKKFNDARWHKFNGKSMNPKSGGGFKTGWENIARACKIIPGAPTILNMTDGSSALTCFDTIHPDEVVKMLHTKKMENENGTRPSIESNGGLLATSQERVES